MKSNGIWRIIFAVVCLAAVAAEGQKSKKAALPPGDLFFTLKGRPFALERIVPGIQAALLFTDEQKLKLTEALEYTIWSERVKSAGMTLKTDPNLTDAGANEARKIVDEARARLEKQVAGILSQEQKALIGRLNQASAEAHIAARKKLELEFTADKRDKLRQEELNRQMREEVRAELNREVQGILSADQYQAMEKAAQQQKEAEAAAKKDKAPTI